MKKNKMKFLIGEDIKIISGKYKNKIGKIKKILHQKNRVIIENINMKTKHIKPTQTEEKGKILQIESYIHISNIIKYTINN